MGEPIPNRAMVDIRHAIREHLEVIERLEPLEFRIRAIAERLLACLSAGGKICWMGNGGSAADSQHLAAELVGRYDRERPGIASIALTTDSSALTAIANDYDYDRVFARQVEALCDANDAVIGISTSGSSASVIAGIRAARGLGAYTVGLAGGDGGLLAEEAEDCLVVPSRVTARVQEAHILLGHLLCECIDRGHGDAR